MRSLQACLYAVLNGPNAVLSHAAANVTCELATQLYVIVLEWTAKSISFT